MTAVDPDVLVVGEALTDVVTGPDGTREHPGGSAANVALTLGRLGRRPHLATWLADDERGRAIRARLTESGVRLTAASLDATRTSVAHATLDADGDARYRFDIEWAPALAGLGTPDLVHVGSLGTELEPGASAVRSLVGELRATSTVTYDPNLRPVLLPARELVRGRVEDLVASADVVKVSDEDLAWLVPGADPRDVVRDWASRGPALVIATLGGNGAFAVTCGGAEAHVPGRRVVVADTVGAGDSFMGALVDGLVLHGFVGAAHRDRLRAIDHGTVEAIVHRCHDVAAVTVAREGSGKPWAHELTALRSAPGAPADRAAAVATGAR